MSSTRDSLNGHGRACAYCGGQAVQRDHLIKKAATRRSTAAKFARDDEKYIVPSCHQCNTAIGVRCFVPESHKHLIPTLEAMTYSTYRVWSLEESRAVAK